MLPKETGAKVSAIDSVHFHDPNPTDSPVNFVRPHANAWFPLHSILSALSA